MKYILLVCVAASIASCFPKCCDDCTYSEERLPAYANKSGETVGISYSHYKKSIANGDTLHSSYYFKEKPEEWNIPHDWDCGIAEVKGCSNPVRMELRFLEDPQKCLIFEGPIKHDGIDMRSWNSYKKGNEIDGWADDWWVGMEYVYTITPEHREKGSDCGDIEDKLPVYANKSGEMVKIVLIDSEVRYEKSIADGDTRIAHIILRKNQGNGIFLMK